jgi:oxygen-independent coproporphyrinogen-3 oxidase
MAGLYLHIPFCKQACHYCDFFFSTNQQFRQGVVQAMARELVLQRHYPGDEVLQTLYFGGGTPSLMTAAELQTLMDTIAANFTVAECAEMTLEANPDDLTPKKLEDFRRAGINRLSIGIQSFDDEVLTFFNRSHNSADAVRGMKNARAQGYENISLDLIYAIPGQSLAAWEKNLRRALDLSPEHLSAYSLTIEEKTVFGRWQRTGQLIGTPDDDAAEQFELLMDLMGEAGYEHYEISNFCKPGKYSRHNASYWKQERYLGVGPSAHSFDGISRQFNVSHNVRYVQSIEKEKIPAQREVLTHENKVNEYIFTTLRTQWGCDLGALHTQYGIDLVKIRGSYLACLERDALAIIAGDVLTLTRKGKLLADKIAADLFLDTANS